MVLFWKLYLMVLFWEALLKGHHMNIFRTCFRNEILLCLKYYWI
ncbi:hypothetical protein BpHYR1_043066 [Brachionus plicatilis]|uniref:Uncharacterized protein n=1 Tax=Brachionus plicatilis TaxID=10195 RepID=A0A3M7R9B5_BRAPC|nr:hypothetical protein BpHYR1_043066 [Brachionus plicatilis]